MPTNGLLPQDARDGAQACRLALEKSYTGHHVYLIANADTVFNAPTSELVERHFSAVEWDPEEMKAPAANRWEGREGLLGIGKARRELGFEPRYTWRE
jgi:nucleoside-diphosphate-sugar epimerase